MNRKFFNKIYILNKNEQLGTGNHIIHLITCQRRPKIENTITLNECMCPFEAKLKALKFFKNVSGCKYCCGNIGL